MNGRTLGENLAGSSIINKDVIRPRDNALADTGGTVILRGSLAPDGAVIKITAATPRLLQHTGTAVVFKNYDDLEARINDPALPVTEDSVLVLQSAGPLGGPGMPEWGMLPIPKKLLDQRRAGYVADFGCADERHGIWDLCAACFAGEPCRRAFGVGAGWG